jgi:integrase
MRVMSAGEAAELVAALPVKYQALWATAFFAGLRRGELQALRVCDVDLERGLIRVQGGWDQHEGAQRPKTATGVRVVPLPAVLESLIAADRLRTGRQGEALIFGRSETQAFAPATVNKAAKRAWNKAGLVGTSMHPGRHIAVSIAIDAGASPTDVRAIAGHAKLSNHARCLYAFAGSAERSRKKIDVLSGCGRRRGRRGRRQPYPARPRPRVG